MNERPVAIVTGAGSGIGRATALRLAAAGYAVALVGRTAETLEAVRSDVTRRFAASSEAMVVKADVGDSAQTRGVIDETLGRWGRLDALVNNAGDAPRAAIDETTPETLDRTFATNALGPAYLIIHAWPALTGRKGGCVVNVTTMGTKDPFPGFFAYAAAKCAAESYVRSIAKEGGPSGLRAFAVAPGAVETPLLRGAVPESVVPRDRTLEPDAVARVIVDCVIGRRNDQSGSVIYVPSP